MLNKKFFTHKMKYYIFSCILYRESIQQTKSQRRCTYDITNFRTSPNYVNFDSCTLLYPQFRYYRSRD